MPSLRKNLVVGAGSLLSRSLLAVDSSQTESLARHLASRGATPAMRQLHRFCKAFADAFDAPSQRMHENGEAWLLRQLTPLGFQCMFDVGANVGNWTRLAHAHHPSATIHAFEIVSATYALLKAGAADLEDCVVLNDFGLADREGELEIFAEQNINNSSAFDHSRYGGCDEKGERKRLTCRVETGASYAQRRGVERIDFLKIDVEGSEAAVLRGFGQFFAEKKVRIVQFEYNRNAILSRFLLRDFYEFFGEHGYVVGRLFPDRVNFSSYRLADENFVGPNYIACAARDNEIIRSVAG